MQMKVEDCALKNLYKSKPMALTPFPATQYSSAGLHVDIIPIYTCNISHMLHSQKPKLHSNLDTEASCVS